MIGYLQTRVHKQTIIALYFEFETVLKFHNLEARACSSQIHVPKTGTDQPMKVLGLTKDRAIKDETPAMNRGSIL